MNFIKVQLASGQNALVQLQHIFCVTPSGHYPATQSFIYSVDEKQFIQVEMPIEDLINLVLINTPEDKQ